MSSEGAVLPTMISKVDSGETRIWSKVPNSRSRATDSAGIMIPMIMRMFAIRHGSVKYRYSRFGMYQFRTISSLSGRRAGSRRARMSRLKSRTTVLM